MKLGYTMTFQDIRGRDYFGHLLPRKGDGYTLKMEAWSANDEGIIAEANAYVGVKDTFEGVNAIFTAFIDDIDNGTSILNIKRY